MEQKIGRRLYSIQFSSIQPYTMKQLVIKFEIEIRRVKVVQSNITVLSAAGIRFAIRSESQRVDGTEMALDATEFFFEYQVEETGVEFANPS